MLSSAAGAAVLQVVNEGTLEVPVGVPGQVFVQPGKAFWCEVVQAVQASTVPDLVRDEGTGDCGAGRLR